VTPGNLGFSALTGRRSPLRPGSDPRLRLHAPFGRSAFCFAQPVEHVGGKGHNRESRGRRIVRNIGALAGLGDVMGGHRVSVTAAADSQADVGRPGGTTAG
jgi:hypothetical protein